MRFFTNSRNTPANSTKYSVYLAPGAETGSSYRSLSITESQSDAPAIGAFGRRASRYCSGLLLQVAYSDDSDRSVRGFRTVRIGGRVAADAGRLLPA